MNFKILLDVMDMSLYYKRKVRGSILATALWSFANNNNNISSDNNNDDDDLD